MAADQTGVVTAQELAQGAVDLSEAAVEIDDRHADWRVLERALETLTGGGELVLGALPSAMSCGRCADEMA